MVILNTVMSTNLRSYINVGRCSRNKNTLIGFLYFQVIQPNFLGPSRLDQIGIFMKLEKKHLLALGIGQLLAPNSGDREPCFGSVLGKSLEHFRLQPVPRDFCKDLLTV